MAVSMVLMATVLRSSLGMLAIVGGLWVVALARARAARTSRAAREFLVDLLAMALVLVVPLLHPGTTTTAAGGPLPEMTGMAAVSLPAASAAVVVGAWALARVGLLAAPGTPEARLRGLVSGGCCALGLVAMLVV